MLKDIAAKYYLEDDRNCAESTLIAICQQYGLELSEEEVRLIGGFGGGMSCGKTCGALCGAIGALGKMLIKTKAHETEALRPTCAQMVEDFVDKLGTTECSVLRERFATKERKCGYTVETACDVFEALAAQKGLDCKK